MPSLKELEELINPADPSITGLIPTGATVANGILNHNAVGNATDNLVTGTEGGIDAVAGAGANVKGILDPYAKAGQGALSQLESGIAPGGGLTDAFHYDQGDLENDPGYKFTLDQGLKQAYAQSAARGLSLSGGAIRNVADYTTGLANKTFGENYARAENTFNANKEQRLKALQQLTGTGLTASQGQVQGEEWTATNIAALLGERADALAAGDVAKANSITQTLSGIAEQVTGNGALKKLYDAVRGPQETPETIASAAGGGMLKALEAAGPEGLVSAASTVPALASAAPEILGSVPALEGTLAGTSFGIPGLGAGIAPEALAPAGAPAAGGGIGGGFASIGHAVQSAASGAVNGLQAVGSYMLSNPWTIAVGAAILGVTALLKSQAHFESNTWTRGFQKPFDDQMAQVKNEVSALKASGEYTPEMAQQIQASAQGVLQSYLQKLDDFYREKGTDGSDQSRVAAQAYQTFLQYYGEGGQKFIEQLAA